MADKRFLLLPSAAPGNGTGHIRRAFQLAADLGERSTVGIFIPEHLYRPEFNAFAEEAGTDPELVIRDENELRASSWDFTVWDRRATSLEEYRRWSGLGTPAGIDEGGEARGFFPFLIDTFPLPGKLGPANVSDPAFLPQPDKRRIPPESFDTILISFGGEDPARLTEKVVLWLLDAGRVPPEKITVVLGPLFGRRVVPDGVRILQSPAKLSELLWQYDLVCTSFGLTAYEAAAAGTGVLLFNPSRYHRELSLLAGFTEVGIGKVRTKKMEECLKNPPEHIPLLKGIVPEHPKKLADFLDSLSVPEVSRCPVCEENDPITVFREPSRTFFRCRVCGTIYQMDYTHTGDSYTEEYFFSEYRNQYGRTYLEDFDTIRGLARSRIQHLRGLKKTGSSRLLDVGCAYGPFLKEAAEAGYQVTGIDPAESAVKYVRETLGYAAHCLQFEDYEPDPEGYDLITMWYVIEHFSSTAEALRKAFGLLKPGGILALATPNYGGISGRRDLRSFLKNSPRDHHIIWSPDAAGKAVRRYGFRPEKTVVTGHHPERFFKSGLSGSGSVYKTLRLFSGIAGLGDTFEIYARKTGATNE